MNKIIKNYQNVEYGPALEDNKDVLNWIKNLKSPNYNFINGNWIKSNSKNTIDAIDP